LEAEDHQDGKKRLDPWVAKAQGRDQRYLAAALEDFMDREVALKDEVAAVFDLPDGVKARQIHLFTLGLRELRSQDQCPAVELICRHVVDGQKCVIVLAEGDLGSLNF
jgi:hypothetical protein